ncbi:MAG: protein kinase [Candidatus Aminicenantes bacterium]|jgi:serine/threonine protein kinase/tetratricopeptide (TPR) repeat protein
MGVKCPKCQYENPDDTLFCGKCATRLSFPEKAEVTETLETPKEELSTGSIFAGRYQIIEELGKGGMGKVYRVFDQKLNEEVALKLIKPDIAADKKTIERFKNELKLARKIRHKTVGSMYELLEDNGVHFITMEYVSGQDLKGLIRQTGQLTVGKAIFIAKQICDGLSEAHSLGVVHRDLKPNNIMIDRGGNAIIMDFGIARAVKGKGITGAGVAIGTPQYMSPEQVEGKDVDLRSDIYSLGIILYEMLTDRLPFEGDTPITVGVKQKTEMPKDPKEFNARIPDDLNRLILKCLEKERENRYQSAVELRSELDRIEQGLPTTDRVVSQKKPLTSKEITVTFGMKKWLVPVLVVFVLMVVGLLIWKPWSRKESVPVPSDKPSLAVVYFTNETGDNNLDHWRSALPTWLITDLSQSKYIRVLGVDQLLDIHRKLDLVEARSYSRQDLINVAREGSVDYVLQASLSKAGTLFRVDYRLLNTITDEEVCTDYITGEGEDNFHIMVDELTKKLKGDLRLSPAQIAGDIDREIGEITTSSPEALNLYREGYKFHNEGEYHIAIEYFDRAISLDPEFASAFRSMATAYGNMGYIAEKRKYLQKAMELSDRVTDREFYRNQADFYKLSEKTYDKAIEAYEKLIELYPEYVAGYNGLGVLYWDLEEWDKAIEQYEIPIQNRSASPYPYGNLAVAYKAKGQYAKAREVLENYIESFSDRASFHGSMANSYLCQRQYDLALAEVDKAFALIPTDPAYTSTRGKIYLCKGDLDTAEAEFRKLLTPGEPRAWVFGRIGLASVYLLQGEYRALLDEAKQGVALSRVSDQKRWQSDWHWGTALFFWRTKKYEEALKEWDKAINTAVDIENMHQLRRNLLFKGLTHTDMGSIDLAEEVAAELKALTETGMNTKHMRFYYHMMGNIELEKTNFPQAIDYFEKAVSLLPHEYHEWHLQALFYDSLALAYFLYGSLEKALKNYEKITLMTTGRIYLGDIYAKSFYKLGRIYEQLGSKDKAIEHYETFLDLLKNADPGLPEANDSKMRLASLQIQ